MPIAVMPQDIVQLPLQVAAPSWATLAFSFSRSMTGITATSSYIAAWSDAAPASNINFGNATFMIHNVHQVLPQTDFSVLKTDQSSGTAASSQSNQSGALSNSRAASAAAVFQLIGVWLCM
jgi:hypothetical protein